MTTKLKAASLESALAVAVCRVNKIERAARGPISVAEVHVTEQESLLPAQPVLQAPQQPQAKLPSPPPAPPVRVDAQKERSHRSGRDHKAQRDKEARRARRALEDAIVLASRIQLLRAEGARTRRKIQLATEKKQAVIVASQRAHTRQASDEALLPAWAAVWEEGPPRSTALALRARFAKASAALRACGLALHEEVEAVQPRGDELQVPHSLWTKMAAAQNSMLGCNAALWDEVGRLQAELKELLGRRSQQQ